LKDNCENTPIIVFLPKLCQILPLLLVWPVYKTHSFLVSILWYQKCCLYMSIFGKASGIGGSFTWCYEDILPQSYNLQYDQGICCEGLLEDILLDIIIWTDIHFICDFSPLFIFCASTKPYTPNPFLHYNSDRSGGLTHQTC